MFKIIINKITSNLIKKEKNKLKKKMKKRFKKIYAIQEKKFSIEKEKLLLEINFLNQKEEKFKEDIITIKEIFNQKPEVFHVATQKASLILQEAIVNINSMVYQGIVPHIEEIEHRLRRTDKKQSKDKTNIKIISSNTKKIKAISKISKLEDKKMKAL